VTAAPGSLTLRDAFLARRRIANYVRRTPLTASTWLSDAIGARVSLKLESLQGTRSFKLRGGFNAVFARLERSDAPAMLVTASAGNHGLALASAAAAANLPVTIFTPKNAPRSKLDEIRRLGATLRDEANNYDETERLAKAFAASTGAAFISPYSDVDVIAGASTIALEIFEDAPDVDTLIVPIGGGGLIAGVAQAAKSINPSCRIVGIEAAVSCPFRTSVRAGKLVEIVPGESLADGLTGNPDPETITFAIIQQFVDEIVTVTEDELVRGITGLVESEHVIAEGAGAIGVAALLAERVSSPTKHAAVIVSGGNIDRSRLASLLGV